MTAPIRTKEQINEYNITTQKNMTYRLLDAIDKNDFLKLEKVTSEILDNNISLSSILVCYKYSLRIHKIKVCEYFKHILLIDNNY